MPKDNSHFFEKKQLWSSVKDELLGCYLKPYMQKILMTRKPIYYVDCFAGKGRFDDGADGSPLIALKIIEDSLKSTNATRPSITSCYIDLNYADDLHRNLSQYHNLQIVSGKYEDNIIPLLERHKKQNIFLYIDPYGIKALDCGLFDRFMDSGFNSIEMLINMNSFGFLREACRAMKASQVTINEFNTIIGDDLVEYDPSYMDPSEQSIRDLTAIAGGEYWKAIIREIIAGKMNGYDAEQKFARCYCERLKQKYKYVLNMPIRLKQGQRPKYRMIHVTNHEDGCVLMYENICKRWEALDEIQTGGQFNMFTSDVEGDVVDLQDVQCKLQKHMRSYKEDTKLNIILAEFYSSNGVMCKKPEITGILKKLEAQGVIEITREPPFTKKGEPSSFMTETSKQHIWIRSMR
jgi:three-Cys-motif partner protein